MIEHNSMQLQLIRHSLPPALGRHQFMLSGQWISYILKRSPRRCGISFTVNQDGLRVAAPWRASQRRIESLLVLHARWIMRKLTEWEARRPAPFTWQAGATIMFMGTPLQLTPAAERTTTERDSDRLYVAIAAQDPEALARHVLAWLRDVAHTWFRERAAYFSPLLAVRPPTIRLSDAKTRWGACHPAGRIHLSWRLIHMPPALIDYVVVHELAHLHEPNHSPRFWRRVNAVLPDHKLLRQALRCEAHRYLIT
jgi:predicted metal-dependent hydrolase